MLLCTGQPPADRSARMAFMGEFERLQTVGGEPAVERISAGGGRRIWVVHDGWMYELYFPAPNTTTALAKTGNPAIMEVNPLR